jgi:glycine cleavage system H protein
VWVRSEGERSARIGIEPGFASALVSPKAIVLPALGEHVVRNNVCSWIVLEGGTLPIVSPMDGKVIATNAHLAENPRAVCLSPLGQGWLFELEVDGGVKEDMNNLAIANVARIYGDDERRFQTLLFAEFTKGGTEVGLTLADGGQALENLAEVLGPTKYFKLVRSVYG